MSNIFLKAAIRTLFNCTSKTSTISQTEKILGKYFSLINKLDDDGAKIIKVPKMIGVDEDMRSWSFFMILEHNTIVNKTITNLIKQLANNETLSGLSLINPKTDVMPSITADSIQITEFKKSVDTHIELIKDLKNLRGTKTSPHPLFGKFDAHKWCCLFPFHLGLHYKQAEYVVSNIKNKNNLS